jgi:hypothetical protein
MVRKTSTLADTLVYLYIWRSEHREAFESRLDKAPAPLRGRLRVDRPKLSLDFVVNAFGTIQDDSRTQQMPGGGSEGGPQREPEKHIVTPIPTLGTAKNRWLTLREHTAVCARISK